MKVAIAVLSDLHCHPKSIIPIGSYLYTDMTGEIRKNHPIRSLQHLIDDKGIRSDLLIVPGDLTNQAHPEGLSAGWRYAKEVQKCLDANIIIGTVGNHDVDSRHVYSDDAFHYPRTFDPEFPTHDVIARSKFWSDGYCFVESVECRILVINSVARHLSIKEVKRGAFGEQYLEKLSDELNNIRKKNFQIAMVHHHPLPHEDIGLGAEDLMVGGQQLLELLNQHEFDLIIHGHKHHPRLVYGAGGANSIAVFASGSVAASNGSLSTNTRNLFHLITLDNDEIEDCGKHGEIKSWEFNMCQGWNEPNVQSASFPSLTGFGCRATPQTMAKRLNDCLSGIDGALIPWQTALDYLPQLRYLIPRDFKEFERHLLVDYQIIVQCVRDSDIPFTIGRVS